MKIKFFTAISLFVWCSSSFAGLVLNEYMSDPRGTADFDSNFDGSFDSVDDEYVEFVNDMAVSLDISDWTVDDGGGLKHTFASGTILSPGQALVLFGGGTPDSANFGGALVATASSGSLALNNGGDTVTVADDSMTTVFSIVFGSSDGESLTRSPDLTGAFVSSSSVGSMAAGTPGFKIDGTAFAAVPEPSQYLALSLVGIVGVAASRKARNCLVSKVQALFQRKSQKSC